jgi:hypothetical protein
MSTIAKAVITNVFLPGVGYLLYNVPQRKVVGWLFAILTFLEIALFIYTPLSQNLNQLTFHWSPFLDPSRWAFRILIALDTYSLMKLRAK